MMKSYKIFIRDSYSEQYADAMGILSCLSTDIAFSLPYKKLPSDQVVGINVSGLLWRLHESQTTDVVLNSDYRKIVVKSVEVWLPDIFP